MFTHLRSSLSLNGTWKFCPDPMQRCRRQQWWKNPSKPNQMFPCWESDGLWDIQVPGTWKKQFDSLEWYDGHAVYFREFDGPEIPAGHEAFLVFDGVVYASEVYLNGQFLARHAWGYSPFAVRVTETIRKHNQLFVLVDNLLSPQRVPGEIFDWNNDGGIINGVKLVVVPGTHIENFRTQTRLDGDRVKIELEVLLSSRDAAAREEVEIHIPELDLQVTGIALAGVPVRIEAVVPRSRIALWTPENPKLYETTLATRFETLRDEIGYREIRTDGPQILLNGKPLRLYGVCVHSEFPDTGRTSTAENIAKLVASVKGLGVNFLRCAHYPYAEEFGRAMDRAGLLWWQEVPAYWLFSMREEPMTALACGMLEEAIRRDWNRASLIIWSISNECCWRNPENPEEHNYAYWIKAAALVRRLDPSRLLTCAEAGNIVSSAPGWTPSRGDLFAGAGADREESHRPMHADAFYQLLDVLAANLYVSAPGEEAVLYPRWVKLMEPFNKPLMLSEFGSMSVIGDDRPGQLGGEPWHCEVLEKAYRTFEGLPKIVGYAPWVLLDGRAPIHWRWYNQGTGLFRYGLMNENWLPKKAYNVVRDGIAQLKKRFEDQ